MGIQIKSIGIFISMHETKKKKNLNRELIKTGIIIIQYLQSGKNICLKCKAGYLQKSLPNMCSP